MSDARKMARATVLGAKWRVVTWFVIYIPRVQYLMPALRDVEILGE